MSIFTFPKKLLRISSPLYIIFSNGLKENLSIYEKIETFFHKVFHWKEIGRMSVEMQVSDVIYAFNAAQLLRVEGNVTTLYVKNVCIKLRENMNTVGPESRENLISFLTVEVGEPRIREVGKAKEFLRRLIYTIGLNNENYQDTTGGTTRTKNHFGYRYTPEETKHINNNMPRQDNPGIIMNGIEFLENEDGFLEAVRRKTCLEKCKEQAMKCLFG